MNRRNFIKGVTGFIAGIYAVFVPKAKGLTLEKLYQCRDELEKAEKAEKFNTEDFGDVNFKDGWSHIVGVEFIDGKEVAVYGVYIDGKKATKLKDGSYRVEA